MNTPALPDEALDDDLYRRIGRNLVVFQRIETNLKGLMSVNQMSFRLSLDHSQDRANRNILNTMRTKATKRSGQTLGSLVGDYVAEVLDGSIPPEPDPPQGTATIAFGYQLSDTCHDAESARRRLEAIVRERNELVHGLLNRLIPGSQDKIAATRTWLDEQYDLATTYLADLRGERQLLAEARLAQIEYMRTPDFMTSMEQAWRVQSPLAQHFATEAGRTRRPDGWAALTTASQTAHVRLPEEVAHLKDRYGCARIPELLESTGLFEFRSETTRKGGIRHLYRLKSGKDEAPGTQAPEPLP